jgi:putative membrane protein
MLVSYRPSWSRILSQTGRPLALFFVVSLVVTSIYELGFRFRVFSVPDLPLSLLGSALGIFLGFRTNSAYGRWWEARQLWGALVNQSRTWTRQIISFSEAAGDRSPSGPDPEIVAWQKRMVYAQIAFAHALRYHLRGENPLRQLEAFLDPDRLDFLQDHKNVPAALLHMMGKEVTRAADTNWFGEMRLLALNQTLTELTNIQGGCERIRNTPLPRQYDYYPELFLNGYCFLLPLALVPDLGYVTPVLTLLIGFVLIVLNRIGKNLEDPFDSPVYGIPMVSLSTTIEIDLRQQLGEDALPTPIRPEHGVLR